MMFKTLLKLIKYKPQIQQLLNMQTGGYLLQNWVKKCNYKKMVRYKSL